MSCVIFGAGKIARGFIGHLLYLSGIPFTFVEKADALVDLINERGEYTVNVLGNPDKNCVVKGARALSFTQEEEIAEAIASADAVFNAVGGKNLEAIVPHLTRGIERKAKIGGKINFITCENWKQPADILRRGIEAAICDGARAYFEENVGITEAVIMRSAIESPAELLAIDPLIVNVQDFWELPMDASRVKGKLPEILGLKPIEAFTGFLERKFYTYNAANGTTSFVGALLGYEKIADAAHDERILTILDGVYQETARALSIKHNFPLEEQLAFTLTSKRKLQDYTIVDFIERNARDPMRKLGPDDRLVGSARLVESCGIEPKNLAVAIAAAIYYTNDADESAVELRRMRQEEGVNAVLEKVCKMDPDGSLAALVKKEILAFKAENLIREDVKL